MHSLLCFGVCHKIILRYTSALSYGVLPYLGSFWVLREKGSGRRESSTGRDAVALPREVEFQHLAAGRVIVRHEDGGRAPKSFRFLPLGGQAACGAKQPVLCVLRVACFLIRLACAPQREPHVAIVFRLLEQGRRTIKRRRLGRM